MALVVALMVLATASSTYAAPRTPGDAAEVLEKLPLQARDAAARELSGLRTALANAPTDAVAAARLAEAYFDMAAARGDPRYVGYAEAVVNRFPQPLPLDLLRLAASHVELMSGRKALVAPVGTAPRHTVAAGRLN